MEQIAQCTIMLLPNTGFDQSKIAVSVSLRLRFQTTYPKAGLTFELIAAKGLDDDQVDTIKTELSAAIKEHVNSEVEEEGVLYNLHDSLREIISRYNDTVRGRCSVCLENFCEDEALLETQTFTDRDDLARID